MLNLILVVVVVLMGSALCSSSEAALFSVSLIKAQQLARSRKPAALALLKIRKNMNRPITSLVILNNLFNILGSILIGRLATSVLGDAWLGIFSALLTFLIIIFGEIIPKTLGERYSESLALSISIPVAGLTFLLTPIVWLMEKVTAPFTQGADRPLTNEAEIQMLAEIGHQEGIIEGNEAEMIQQVFKLNDLTAADLMTPRVAITYLRGDLTLAEAKQDIITSQHTRIIVIDKTIDQVKGVVLKDMLLTAMIEGRQEERVDSLLREVRFVPEVVRADKLLKTFQATREHLVVVLDEYGGVSGVVTLEDVLEVLTGEIVDETDLSIDLQALARKRVSTLLSS